MDASWTYATLVAVVGPTATGKSDVALDLAEKHHGVIINADASQLYRGMDIGTAKVPPSQRRGIPHYQLDVLDIHEEASVAAYQRAARADMVRAAQAGSVPFLVGGTGLYVRAALDPFEIPPTHPEVRARWQARADEEGVEALYAELQRQDPHAASRIEPKNVRRVVRALEVMELTGQPFSASLPTYTEQPQVLTIGLRDAHREALDERIERRCQQMWKGGLLEEVAELETRGLSRTPTARTAIGYAQALAQLRGELTQEQAIDATAQATRRLARRQLSWFGRDPRIRWYDPSESDTAKAVESAVRSHLDSPR